MKLEFNNLNPCLFLDNIIKNGISATDVAVTSNIKENELIAETVWIECNNNIDTIKITEIANNVIANQNTNVIVTEPTNADLQAQIFNLTTQLVNGGVI
ncbi:CCR4-NOT transcriptional regulation complex NOT5 subunit [Clostridium beijerinckii]|uniref:hypothetical protein n=1 Tax=Clostridium beijerinckii TaxID=1520 RepID=UPI00156FDB80|nr:hypothetical protein [Clostridium beijerinckii]NRT32657.1 CCR4-NOT transcriptional regulation complex NOT5 subunit [Clostridium beijerinckii]NRT34147.1 CCR4-NOT transcriptional regulation complex NOT5 subunit [Clostridium beijerinckii]NRT46424.1 CCR4-NOT transcriptional regulation complex NOT5 subunit [Clostridium beijerinckii]NRT47915.1 CCR4-NOT transcriptional regulation complex NOT5 subunit [Clostridium beijerinckii]NRZ19572.1 CCR4-NOT transcriptional regulation complex NOT5 subunit [Clo